MTGGLCRMRECDEKMVRVGHIWGTNKPRIKPFPRVEVVA